MASYQSVDGEARDLLMWVDSLGTDNIPPDMIWNGAWNRFDRLVECLGNHFDLSNWCDEEQKAERRLRLEESCTLDLVRIPASSVSAKWDVEIRVSTFFPAVAYYLDNWVDGIPVSAEGLLESDVQSHIDRCLEAQGYRSIKSETLLFGLYDGRYDVVRRLGYSWFRWTFGYR